MDVAQEAAKDPRHMLLAADSDCRTVYHSQDCTTASGAGGGRLGTGGAMSDTARLRLSKPKLVGIVAAIDDCSRPGGSCCPSAVELTGAVRSNDSTGSTDTCSSEEWRRCKALHLYNRSSVHDVVQGCQIIERGMRQLQKQKCWMAYGV